MSGALGACCEGMGGLLDGAEWLTGVGVVLLTVVLLES
jgi:hypothetical protein